MTHKVDFRATRALLHCQRVEGLELAVGILNEEEGLVWAAGSRVVGERKRELENVLGSEGNSAGERRRGPEAVDAASVWSGCGEVASGVPGGGALRVSLPSNCSFAIGERPICSREGATSQK